MERKWRWLSLFKWCLCPCSCCKLLDTCWHSALLPCWKNTAVSPCVFQPGLLLKRSRSPSCHSYPLLGHLPAQVSGCWYEGSWSSERNWCREKGDCHAEYEYYYGQTSKSTLRCKKWIIIIIFFSLPVLLLHYLPTDFLTCLMHRMDHALDKSDIWYEGD